MKNKYCIDLSDINKVLIITKKSNQTEFVDITDDLEYIYKHYLFDKHTSYIVKFKNGTKEYEYRKELLEIYQNPIVIMVKNQTVKIGSDILFNVERIVQFDSWYRIYFIDGTLVLKRNIEIDANPIYNQKKLFQYYKELAKEATTSSSEEQTIDDYIYKQYEKITKINDQSVLNAYFNAQNKKFPFWKELIFPFSFNLSQMNAVKEALTNQVSIIEGPPGCGKTQTILNLIANLIIQGQTVAIVSNNNTAIRNIYDKLFDLKLEFCVALLGNKENQTEFFEDLSNETLDNFLKTTDLYSNTQNNNYSFRKNEELLKSVFHYENDLAQERAILNSINKEYEHFSNKHKNSQTNSIDFKVLKYKHSSWYLEYKVFLEEYDTYSFFEKFIFRIKYKIKKSQFQLGVIPLLLFLENEYYCNKISESKDKIEQLENKLKLYNFEQLKKEHEKQSLRFFKQQLYKKYANIDNKTYDINTYKQNFAEFLVRYPIILSTSHSLLSSKESKHLFDFLIVDEASQSEMLSSIIAMSCARNLVVVGDSKQLEQINNKNIINSSKELAKKYQISKEYIYEENSLLGSIRKVYKDGPVTLLREHYRCHPTIINFINSKYYNNELVIMTKPKERFPITILKLVEGNHARRNPDGPGQYNQREIDEIKEYLKNNDLSDVGIISPFRFQVSKYIEQLTDVFNIEIDTVHKFQGRQKQNIILSTVVNNLEISENNERLIDFINNPKLFNVALSRAINKVVLVVTHNLYNSSNNNFSDFIRYAEYNIDSTEIMAGKVTSVFDMLYRDYSEVYKEFLSKKISKNVPTEIIIYDLLKETLKEFPLLSVSMHTSVRNIIKNYSDFNDEEQRYLKNHLTHVDFLIYNSLTKQNMLAIEVDGIRYHEQKTNQLMKDAIKNKALEQNNIPLLRLKTNESKEKERIINYLRQIYTE